MAIKQEIEAAIHRFEIRRDHGAEEINASTKRIRDEVNANNDPITAIALTSLINNENLRQVELRAEWCQINETLNCLHFLLDQCENEEGEEE